MLQAFLYLFVSFLLGIIGNLVAAWVQGRVLTEAFTWRRLLIFLAIALIAMLVLSRWDQSRQSNDEAAEAMPSATPDNDAPIPTISSTPPPTSTATPTATSNPTQTATPTAGLPTRSAAPGTGRIVFTCQITSLEATPDANADEICIIDVTDASVNADSSSESQLTENGSHDGNPFLSPDGEWVAFESFGGGLFWRWSSTTNMVTAVANSRLSSGSALMPAISPDGKQVAIAVYRESGAQIWVVNADGSNPIQVTSGSGTHTSPVWSPNGDRLAYAHSIPGRDGGQYRYFTIDIDVDTGQLTQPTPVPMDLSQVPSPTGGRIDWSPDGQWIAFHAGESAQIFLTHIDSDEVYNLSERSGGSYDDRDPAFSPDGSWLTFSSLEGGDREIWIMRLDGSTRLQITDNSRYDSQPRWGP